MSSKITKFQATLIGSENVIPELALALREAGVEVDSVPGKKTECIISVYGTQEQFEQFLTFMSANGFNVQK